MVGIRVNDRKLGKYICYCKDKVNHTPLNHVGIDDPYPEVED